MTKTVTITVTRRALLEKPMGLGQGRIVEGYLDDNFRTAVTIYTGSPALHPGSSQMPLGLKTITNFIVSPGTPVSSHTGVACQALVLSPGSPMNSVKIMAQLIQKGLIGSITPTVGSTRFPIAFGGTPEVTISWGSPAGAIVGYSSAQFVKSIRSRSKTAVYYRGTPTFRGNPYIAVGPGSLRLNFIAVGD